MSEAAGLPRYSLEEYLILEEMSNVRHEFLDGHIYAVAGGTPEHGRVCANLIALLSSRLEGRPCAVFTLDVRVRIRATGLDTYPDVSVVCGPIERDPVDRNAIVNPVVLVEVTSRSTEAYDRGDKLAHYEQVPSLREVVIASHSGPAVDVWRRGPDGGWTRESCGTGEVVRLSSLGCEMLVEAIYRNPLSD